MEESFCCWFHTIMQVTECQILKNYAPKKSSLQGWSERDIEQWDVHKVTWPLSALSAKVESKAHLKLWTSIFYRCQSLEGCARGEPDKCWLQFIAALWSPQNTWRNVQISPLHYISIIQRTRKRYSFLSTSANWPPAHRFRAAGCRWHLLQWCQRPVPPPLPCPCVHRIGIAQPTHPIGTTTKLWPLVSKVGQPAEQRNKSHLALSVMKMT